MKPRARNFDRLAKGYAVLEFLAFGRDLERARFALLDQLRDRREILVLGEGDGRALVRLLELAPLAQIHCLDFSEAMLRRAAARILPADRARVTFLQADVLIAEFPPKQFDAVTTVFFLDCFTADEVARIATRVGAALHRDALWLFVDFSLPERGYNRFRARAWLGLLFAFFRWSTGIAARALPPSEKILQASGWREISRQEFQHGLLRAVLFGRPETRP